MKEYADKNSFATIHVIVVRIRPLAQILIMVQGPDFSARTLLFAYASRSCTPP